MPNDQITNCLRKLRFDKDQMTQQQLADIVGVTRQTIIAIESGKYLPSLPLAFKIANTFEVKIEDVFKCQNEKGAD
jgi:putative transcriptional regulator